MGIAAYILLTVFFFGVFAESVQAQLSDSDGSARWVAAMIASDGKGSAEDYRDYAERLTKTMSQYPAAVQTKIFGFLPSVGGNVGDSAGSANVPAGNNSPGASAALANPSLSSGAVFDALLSQSPLSDGDLLKVLEREPALEKEHLSDLLKAQGKISRGTQISALASSKLKLAPAELKALLISQSPLDKTVLKKVKGTSKLSPNDIAEVLAAQ